jgi:hypothetical protein
MEAIFSSETSVFTRATRRHMPEDGILHKCDLTANWAQWIGLMWLSPGGQLLGESSWKGKYLFSQGKQHRVGSHGGSCTQTGRSWLECYRLELRQKLCGLLPCSHLGVTLFIQYCVCLSLCEIPKHRDLASRHVETVQLVDLLELYSGSCV